MLVTITCATCSTEFEHDAQGGFRPERCPPCRTARKREKDREKAKRWREANPERAREHWNKHNRKQLADPVFRAYKRDLELKRVYGITRAELDALIESQGGKCAICGGDPNGPGTRLHIDHCHDSKRIRGLLCAKCNTAIGLLDDDPVRADALASYLRR